VPLTDPWFWALLGVLGWGPGVSAFFGIRRLGRSLIFGSAMFVVAEAPRILLPLPFVTQPRISASPVLLITVGCLIVIGSLPFGAPVFRIVPLRAPDQHSPLRTDGLYSMVRHPLMVCDILWPLGWSLIFGSVVGIALTVVWALIIWVETYLEEAALVREYGDAYRDFQAHVPRLIPRLVSRRSPNPS
jgi:protein-S-isoprenylcysteine O-methyltransferase Ste14